MSPANKVQPGYATLAKVAALLGLVQGLAWAIMSLICIAMYISDYTPPAKDPSYMNDYQFELFVLFLYRATPSIDEGLILTPPHFTIFAWLELLESSSLFVISVLLLFALKGSQTSLTKMGKVWCYILWISFVLDFIFVIILGVDFHKCMTHADNINQDALVSVEAICTTVYIPVLTIVARGFVLWLVNLTISAFLFKTPKNRSNDFLIPRPRLTVQQPNQMVTTPYQNPVNFGYKNQDERLQNYWNPTPGGLPAASPSAGSSSGIHGGGNENYPNRFQYDSQPNYQRQQQQQQQQQPQHNMAYPSGYPYFNQSNRQ